MLLKRTLFRNRVSQILYMNYNLAKLNEAFKSNNVYKRKGKLK